MTATAPHLIRVYVISYYLPEQSDPLSGRYVFAYTVTLENHGQVAAKLLTRHWLITDAEGRTQEVKGDGVIGEQPRLLPGQRYQYTSGTLLETPVGSMRGSYQMLADDGTRFDAEIPVFTLSVPHVVN